MLLFFALSILFGVLFSELGMSVQTLLLVRHQRPRDRFLLFVSAFAEYLGMRQIIVFSRAISQFQVKSRRGQYWATEDPVEESEHKSPAKAAS